LTVCIADLFILEEEVAEKTKVTRISAKDDSKKSNAKAESTKTSTRKKVKKSETVATETKGNLFVRIGRYFKGAWTELRLVRWPTRKATWGLTLAVILFSAFFVALILLLDALFKWLFELIIS
jgi:preprotein translocase subunit SecE